MFGTRDSGTRGLGCGDTCMGDVGMWYVGAWGYGNAGTPARSAMWGGEKQKEPFSTSNEYKIQFPEYPRSLALRGSV